MSEQRGVRSDRNNFYSAFLINSAHNHDIMERILAGRLETSVLEGAFHIKFRTYYNVSDISRVLEDENGSFWTEKPPTEVSKALKRTIT